LLQGTITTKSPITLEDLNNLGYQMGGTYTVTSAIIDDDVEDLTSNGP
jgi:hypothetical protein